MIPLLATGTSPLRNERAQIITRYHGHDHIDDPILSATKSVLIIHSSPVDGVVVMQKDANGLVSLPLDHPMGRLQVDASDELWETANG